LQKTKEGKEMKAAVRLAILVAALLLVANMAFAAPVCDQELCYDTTYTDDEGNVVWEDTLWVCLNDDGTGGIYQYLTDFSCDLYLFGGGPGWFNATGAPAFGGKPKWSTWLAIKCSSYIDAAYSLQPIGDGYLLTGLEEFMSDRYAVTGKKVPMSNCPD
jgi:hypothetical protein